MTAGSYTYAKEQIGTRLLALWSASWSTQQIRRDFDRLKRCDAITVAANRDDPEIRVPMGSGEPQHDASEMLFSCSRVDPAGHDRSYSVTKDEVDPVRRLIGTASAWGGNPEKYAIYLNVDAAKNDGARSTGSTSRRCRLTRFWSVSLYNA